MKIKDSLILISFLIILSSCQRNEYACIKSSFMQNPKLSQKQQILKNNIENYFNSEITLKYHLLNNRYSSISKIEFTSDDESSYKLAFCKTLDNVDNLYILLLSENNLEQWKVVDEISVNESDLESVYIKDINNDGKNEILVCKKTLDSNFYADVYSYNGSDIISLGVLEDSIF